MDRRSYGISTRPDDPNTITRQSIGTNKSPRYPVAYDLLHRILYDATRYLPTSTPMCKVPIGINITVNSELSTTVSIVCPLPRQLSVATIPVTGISNFAQLNSSDLIQLFVPNLLRITVY